MSQFRDHCELFAAGSSVYVNYAWMMRASLSHNSPAATVYTDDDAQNAYDSYAFIEVPTVLDVQVTEERGNIALHASFPGGPDL